MADYEDKKKSSKSKKDWKEDNKDWGDDDAYPKQGFGTVIEVPDGATLVLNTATSTGKKSFVERKLCIAGCMAPRLCTKLARNDEGQKLGDQHYAWESREYLRNWLLGKKVQYKVLFSKGEKNAWREYADIRFETTNEEGKSVIQNVATQLVYECTVKFANNEQVTKGYGKDLAEDLEAASIALNELKYGVYGRKTQFRDLLFINPGEEESDEWIEKNKGVYRECVIEHVRDAGQYRVCVLPNASDDDEDEDPNADTKYVYLPFLLSGLVCPGFAGKDENWNDKEALKGNGAHKAKQWVMQRLLNKKLLVKVESVMKPKPPPETGNSGKGGKKGKGKGKGGMSFMEKNSPSAINPGFFGKESVFASLNHPNKGSIADFLLEEGFGVCFADTAAFAESGVQALLGAQNEAIEKRRGRWKNYDPEEDDRRRQEWEEKIKAEYFEFRGQVVEVVAGDQFKIIDMTPDGERKEMRYYLANCQTRADNKPAYGSLKTPSKDDPSVKLEDEWTYATNEYFRKKLVGRTVTVKLEYKRHISYYLKRDKKKKYDDEGPQGLTLDDITEKKDKKDEKKDDFQSPFASDEYSGELYFVTLTDDKKNNVGIKGLEEGLLFLESQKDEYYRSTHWNELTAAEKKAKEEKKGKHGDAAAPEAPRYTELIMHAPSGGKGNQVGRPRGPTTKKELSELAAAYENQLKGKEHQGIVTYCLSGSRCRMKLPHEKLMVNFQIAGVRSPIAERFGGGGIPARKGASGGGMRPEPFGNEALKLARESILQQDVKVVIDRIDPTGTFMGQLYTTSKDGRTKKNDLAKELLSRGYAWTDFDCYNNEYKTVEAAAKEAKLGCWSVERKEPVKVKEEHDELAIGEMFQGSISYVTAIDDFYVIPDPDEQEEVQNKIKEIEEYCKMVDKPRKQELYLVQDWEDKNWYRASYEGAGYESGHYSFKYVDTGATADVEQDCVKSIPKGHELADIKKCPVTAVNCQLYGVKSVEDTWEAAGESLFKMTNKKDIMGVVEYRTGGKRDIPLKLKVTLMMGKKIVQEELLNEGVVRLRQREDKPGGGRVDYKTWKDAQEKAKRARVNMWKMGDPGDSEDERWG